MGSQKFAMFNLCLNKILFVGNFLSKKRGTLNPSELIAARLKKEGFAIQMASRCENLYFRAIDIVIRSAFFNYQIIHIDVFSGRAFRFAEVSSLIARFRKKKIILTLHGGMLPLFFEENSLRVENLFRRTNRISTPSLYLKSYFEKINQNIIYLPNPIDLSRFPFSIELTKSPKLLWVRAFSKIYKPELAVKVLSVVRSFFPMATLTMVGPDKGGLGEIYSLIDELQLNAFVSIQGPIRNEDLYKYYHSHRVFLNTTSFESFGVAVMEAAACGIPIVSTCVGEIPFLWKDEEEILMVEKQDAMLFAEQVIRILTDDNLAEKLSRNARQKAEQYDWGCLLPKWIELLSD